MEINKKQLTVADKEPNFIRKMLNKIGTKIVEKSFGKNRINGNWLKLGLRFMSEEEILNYFDENCMNSNLEEKINFIEYIQNYKLRIKCIEKISLETERTQIIISLFKDDALKTKYLETIALEENRASIIRGLKDDALKTKYLEKIASEKNRAYIIETLKDDALKTKYLETIELEENRAFIIRDLKDDALKTKYLETIASEKNRTYIIETLKDDALKTKYLEKIASEENRAYIIGSLRDIELVLDYFRESKSENIKEYLFNNRLKYLVALEEFEDFGEEWLEKIGSDEYRAKVISGSSDEKFKLRYLDKIESNKYKAQIIATMSEKQQEKTLKKMNSIEMCELTRISGGIIYIHTKGLNKHLDLLGYNENEIKYISKQYEQIEVKNEYLDETVLFDILTPKYVNIFTEEQIVRISAQPEIQQKIIEKMNNEIGTKMLQEICKEVNESWILQLNNTLENIDIHKELLENMGIQNNTNEIDVKQLLEVISDKKNYFNIKSVEDINNFSEIRKKACLDLLADKENKNISDELKMYSDIEKKKFALLQLNFGTDLEETAQLVRKYGADILEIWKEDRENISLQTIVLMKSILEAEKIEDINIYEPIFKNEDFKAPSVKSISEIEQEIIQYFSQKYNDVIFKPDEINNPNPIILDGSMPFNMVVRVEGAYLGFIEPEDYNDYFNEPDILYHGSCKSFIGNNMLGIADTSYETGPIFGYTDLEYLTMAPYDLWTR